MIGEIEIGADDSEPTLAVSFITFAEAPLGGLWGFFTGVAMTLLMGRVGAVTLRSRGAATRNLAISVFILAVAIWGMYICSAERYNSSLL